MSIVSAEFAQKTASVNEKVKVIHLVRTFVGNSLQTGLSKKDLEICQKKSS